MSEWRGCTTPGCYRPEHARGRCFRHYMAARRGGALDTLPRRRQRAPQRWCAVAGCGVAVHARGHCKGHYMALLADERQREAS